jgi:hypothetical protein
MGLFRVGLCAFCASMYFLILNLVFNLNYHPSHPMLTLGFHHTEILDYQPSTFLANDTVFSFIDQSGWKIFCTPNPSFSFLFMPAFFSH